MNSNIKKYNSVWKHGQQYIKKKSNELMLVIKIGSPLYYDKLSI